MTATQKKLVLGFHGKIIDHLGIQMYQSPTAAIAEIVSNAWDADAEKVSIEFNFNSDDKSAWSITISDDGCGMTLEECQKRYLSVGYNRRALMGPIERSPEKKRPIMGRKGIGKFAGFGIARFINIRTVSKSSTELTEFELDLETIRKGDSYVSTKDLEIEVIKNEIQQTGISHGTTIVLKDLKINRRISDAQFSESLARRFTINATADLFAVLLNGKALSDFLLLPDIEMSFPKDLPPDDVEKRGISIDEGNWALEVLPSGHPVRWKIQFYRELVKNEEMAGITIFAHKKLAQRPFLFNLTGGLASQAGPEYMSGQVVADWVDELGEDVISTERQRLNWENPDVAELQQWGQQLIRRLMTIWKDKRTEKKLRALEDKVSAFAERVKRLGSEGKVVKTALEKLAQMEKLSEEQFLDMGNAVLLAWEGGRLRELIRQIASAPELDEVGLLSILSEANAITALHTAETVKAKLTAIQGLEQRINNKELENAVRDYIAQNPWLIAPQWETFAVEKRVNAICSEAGDEALRHDDFKGRVDLILSSGSQLVLLEFMRPGLTLDRDHLDRFNHYLDIIKEKIDVHTGLGFDWIAGYLIADALEKRPGMKEVLVRMKSDHRFAMSWSDLVANSKHQWREFLDHIKLRAPDDARVQAI